MSRWLTLVVCCSVSFVNAKNIIFPNVGSQKNITAPQLVFTKPPPCADEFGLCPNNTIVDYPDEYINSIFSTKQLNKANAKILRGDDTTIFEVDDDGGLGQRFGGTSLEDKRLIEETAACAASEAIIYPKMGKNMENNWLFVVNNDEVVQGIRVEKCEQEGRQCRFGLGGTICRQKYIYRKLLAVTGDGRIDSDNFRVPSCCVCYIKNEFLSSLSNRFNTETSPAVVNEADQAPSEVARRQRRQTSERRPELEVVGGETQGLAGSPLDNSLQLDRAPSQGTAQQSIETEETLNPSDTVGGQPVGRFAGEIIVHSNPVVIKPKSKKPRGEN